MVPLKRPNILFLLADDQRFDTIHALGNEAIHTPNLDALAQRGCAFTNMQIPGGTSCAVCMPSRAMLNTGRRLFSIQGEGQHIPEDHATLGEALHQSGGYHCHGIGKWHNGPEGYAKSFQSGENIFYWGMWDHWNVPVCDFRENGDYSDAKKPFIMNFGASKEPFWVLYDRIACGVHSTELMADSAIRFLKDYDKEEPFFAYVSFLAPHDPRTMPKQFRDLYDAKSLPLPPNFAPEHLFDYGIRDMRDETLAGYPRTPQEVREHLADYYAMISHLDDAVGRILKVLEDRGMLEDTIVIYTADNGLAVGQHGLMGKQNLYEPSIRVPFLMAGPGIPKNERRDSYHYLLDIFPSLCELTGIPIPQSVEGKSFVPSLLQDAPGRDEVYLAYNEKIHGIKTRRYKLIETRTEETSRTQLFDLIQDPWEMQDLSSKPEYAQTVCQLQERLRALAADWNDRGHPLGQEYWNTYEAKLEK